ARARGGMRPSGRQPAAAARAGRQPAPAKVRRREQLQQHRQSRPEPGARRLQAPRGVPVWLVLTLGGALPVAALVTVRLYLELGLGPGGGPGWGASERVSSWSHAEKLRALGIQVSCGGHTADSCAECPRGHGETWCNGECGWKRGWWGGACVWRGLGTPNGTEADPGCPVGDRGGLFPDEAAQGRLFERLATDPRYRPFGPEVVSRDPWIIVFHTLLSAEECEGVVRDCGEFRPDVVAGGVRSLNRTSDSFNCENDEDYMQRPGIQLYRERLAGVLQVGLEHSEGLSVIRYGPGGHFDRHHDLVDREYAAAYFDNCGPRVLTFMTYLTDVEEGGATRFVHLDVDVVPKAGRAVVWADTWGDRPLEKDVRTMHEGQAVIRGTKVVANTWFLQFDRDANMARGCCRKPYQQPRKKAPERVGAPAPPARCRPGAREGGPTSKPALFATCARRAHDDD
ncbi:unnamed protein product, partial [Prorocentrum cordatum]